MNTCLIEDCESLVENVELGLCATHAHELRKMERQAKKNASKIQALKARKREYKPTKPIRQISPKMADALRIYSQERKEWLQGRMCEVYPEKIATEIHHSRGRGFGFADEFARQNNIILLLDKRFWKAVSLEGHRKITDDSKFAFENGYSLLRTANHD